MSAIGPALPPHLLAKRKRQLEEEASTDDSTSSGAKHNSSPDEPDKRRRVIGPAMPPAPLDTMPIEPIEQKEGESEGDDDEDDDDFGPTLPTASDNKRDGEDTRKSQKAAPSPTEEVTTQEKLKRDEWMMMAPKQDDLAARMDPTKQRPKAFNTGKGARGARPATSDDNSAWHETPEQKQKRLADEMMGVAKKPAAAGPTDSGRLVQRVNGDTTTTATAAPRPAHGTATEKSRGVSLMAQHRQSVGVEADDDPSRRAFDREKDMGSGGQISATQRRQLLNKAADFSSRFSGGGLL